MAPSLSLATKAGCRCRLRRAAPYWSSPAALAGWRSPLATLWKMRPGKTKSRQDDIGRAPKQASPLVRPRPARLVWSHTKAATGSHSDPMQEPSDQSSASDPAWPLVSLTYAACHSDRQGHLLATAMYSQVAKLLAGRPEQRSQSLRSGQRHQRRSQGRCLRQSRAWAYTR